MSLKSVADKYFSNLNSIASRLYSDLEDTKSSYEELWATIPEEEQQTILSESIIKPEIAIKYGSTRQNINKDYAVKLIFDDHCSYRDEHSGPFTFQTQSQRDLTVFQTNKPKSIPERKPRTSKPKPRQMPVYKEPLPQTFNQISDNESSSNNTLPKTGLDFLDNW